MNAAGTPINATQQTQYHTTMHFEDADPIEREGTAELQNDPRFFTENVIEKRLEAFEALAIVTELMSVCAVQQCFELTNDYSWTGGLVHVAVVQLVGFFTMVLVTLLSTIATVVLSLQLFFTIRLMTAGPTGFDKAARFYQDSRMWRWRERAIFGVKWSMVLFMFSTGCMLFVKFYTEGAPQVEKESEKVKDSEYTIHKVIASAVWCTFMALAGVIAWLVREHQQVFDRAYSSLDACHNELNRHLISQRG